MVKLSIDGAEVEAAEGATILEAADAADLYIPRLCSHPDLPAVDPAHLEPWQEVFQGSVSRRHVAGNGGGEGSEGAIDAGSQTYDGCRLCLVQIEGQAEPVRACATPAEEGLRVTTSSAEIEALRRAQLRKIFATHPHACVQCAQRAGCALEPCSTNVAKKERCCPIFHTCELRRVAELVGIPSDTPRYVPANLSIVEDEPLFLRDHNLCIGCLRCVRICRDVREIDALGFVLGEDGRPIVGSKAPTLKDSDCNFCLSCVEVCPTGALRLHFEEARAEDGVRVPPCVAACPAGMQVSRYLREIRRGEFARAEAVIREAAPFPRVLGQICFHPCEEHCLRGELSEPIAICGLKRAALDFAEPKSDHRSPEPRPDSGKKVAVVGAGPAGLTAAWFLRLKGHGVTLIDSQAALGGWLRAGIPGYRLSSEALESDVQEILAIGIESRMGVEVGRDVTFADLLSDHDAVLVAAGARRPKRLPCEGADLPGIEYGLDLLRSMSSDGPGGEPLLTGERVVVIGGGNVAIDVARSAVRLGPAQVHMYCLEQRHEMPAHDWEIEDAEREGIVVHPGWGPLQFVGDGGIERVDFQRCVAVFDEKGRFAPKLDDTVTCSEDADRVLIAIGQELAIEFLEGLEALERTPAGGIVCDRDSMQTSIPEIFTAGEVVSGPASAVEAIGQGRRAASSIDGYLGGDGGIYFPLLDETELDNKLVHVSSFFDLARSPAARLSDSEAIGSFELVEGGFSAAAAVQEAERCLRCDLRLALQLVPPPPEPWLELNAENVASVPRSEGVYQLLDEDRVVYAIQGVSDLQEALAEVLASSSKAKLFLFDEDPMFSKRESELIQEYLQQHGCMPPGDGDDDLDDLF